MSFKDILVTEVTRMSGGRVCVAGIDRATRAMVRPLQPSGANWEEAEWAVEGGIIAVGNIVRAEAAPTRKSAFPHATEDFRVRRIEKRGVAAADRLYRACEKTADHSLRAIFGAQLIDEKYVVEHTQCRSLGCLLVDRAQLRAEATFGKAKLIYDDGHAEHYLPITALATHRVGDPARAAETLRARLRQAARPVALRLGLARGWHGRNGEYDPKRCYLQLNGLIFAP